MTLNLPTPRALYRDGRLTETDRRVFLTCLEEELLDVVDFRELKLAALVERVMRRAEGRTFSRSLICRSLDRLVRHGYLERQAGEHPRAPQRYRIRLAAFRK
jgi:hypothetical protein